MIRVNHSTFKNSVDMATCVDGLDWLGPTEIKSLKLVNT